MLPIWHGGLFGTPNITPINREHAGSLDNQQIYKLMRQIICPDKLSLFDQLDLWMSVGE